MIQTNDLNKQYVPRHLNGDMPWGVQLTLCTKLRKQHLIHNIYTNTRALMLECAHQCNM